MPPSEALSPVKGKVSFFYEIIYFIEAHAVKSVQTTFEISLLIVSNLHLKVVDFTFLAETVHFLTTQNDSNRRRHYSTLDLGATVTDDTHL